MYRWWWREKEEEGSPVRGGGILRRADGNEGELDRAFFHEHSLKATEREGL